jgi:hypothetical protein
MEVMFKDYLCFYKSLYFMVNRRCQDLVSDLIADIGNSGLSNKHISQNSSEEDTHGY